MFGRLNTAFSEFREAVQELRDRGHAIGTVVVSTDETRWSVEIDGRTVPYEAAVRLANLRAEGAGRSVAR